MTVINNDNHGERRIENLVESMSIVTGNTTSRSNNMSVANDDSLLFGHSDDDAKKKTKTTTSSDDENKPNADCVIGGGGGGSSLQQLATKNRSSTHPDVSSDKPSASESSRAESIQGLEAAKLEKLAHIDKKSVGFLILLFKIFFKIEKLI